ncbi:hypothetical protein PFICI_01156 [Pestalotiopsis fici W106-1]|uniref:MMS19 nucleotide excision repair protein n=1 Tax=Pestalotiopsis fici (strain W106-1 / CGMCC3.15140) TaxID=1229662 RepID=W3XMQ7_PESFW|nr:uncharacterized protein PFICI_01156 [Pestalotiopsis fici W106-1]ETS87328.1 hypothetical protein PFICI_01156 [Pestalotiopsis fici W106-1]
MASNPFDDLAVKYVLQDDEAAHGQAAQAAVDQIEQAAGASPTALRAAIGQWVASINRWLVPQADDEDDIISRGKALGFLASTLDRLNPSILRVDQVKLLLAFFCSLFSSDHRAGIDAASKALSSLASMSSFRAIMGNDIIIGITKLGSDDFKRQTPATRLTIYQLVRGLLQNEAVVKDLASQHESSSTFMTALIDLCRNERDPQNLIVWFQILSLFLQNFEPADEVTDEVFKTFSAYFPITLRASAAPSGITVDDLKQTLRSCFSAHQRAARLAIPFLLNKLDQGEAVTVSVKVDILHTLEACLAHYENVQQSVVPYTDQVWSSLKYEVRNGELVDSIEATLKTLATLARRLQGEELQTFLGGVWIDVSDDISNETYTRSAGRLLAAISGASRESFSLSSKQTIPHITATLKNTKSPSHQAELLGVLNALLQVRAVLTEAEGSSELQDDLFGDALFDDVFTRLWSTWTQSQYSPDRPTIIAKLIDGMSYMVMQKSSNGTKERLCSDATCNRAFNWLGTPSIIYPLEGRNFLLGQDDKEYEQIIVGATTALSRLSHLYPSGFQQLLERFLSALGRYAENHSPAGRDLSTIKDVTTRLSIMAFKSEELKQVLVGNTLSLVTALLQGLHTLASASPKYGQAFIEAIHIAIIRPLSTISDSLLKSKQQAPGLGVAESQDWLEQLNTQVQGLPDVNKGNLGDLTKISEDVAKETNDLGLKYQLLLRFSMSLVIQLYRYSLDVRLQHDAENNISIDVKPALLKDADIYLHRLGQFAADVIRYLSEIDQIQLRLGHEAILLFTEPQDADDQETKIARAAGRSDGTWALCRDTHRTAPLVLGIIQSLRPVVLEDLYIHSVVSDLCRRLCTVEPTVIPPDCRAALDAMLLVLSNKLGKVELGLHLDLHSASSAAMHEGFRSAVENNVEARGQKVLLMFLSTLHYLAGDVANYSSNQQRNLLLLELARRAPTWPRVGRQFCRYFEILLGPKDYLTKKSYATIKPLRGQWLYNQIVKPYLAECFPRPAAPGRTGIDDIAATNRSVFVFSLLQHLDYSVWRNEASAILLIVIRALQTFGISKDINTVLEILSKLMEADADLVKEHLRPLITSTLAVYEMARNVYDATGFISDDNVQFSKREAAMCRKLCLAFIGRLPKAFGGTVRHNLLPERQAVLRGLSRACGDPVREVREVAIVARRDWDGLS